MAADHADVNGSDDVDSEGEGTVGTDGTEFPADHQGAWLVGVDDAGTGVYYDVEAGAAYEASDAADGDPNLTPREGVDGVDSPAALVEAVDRDAGWADLTDRARNLAPEPAGSGGRPSDEVVEDGK